MARDELVTVPDDLAEAVWRATDAVPARTGSREAVARRRRTHQRRSAGTAAAVVAVVAAVAVQFLVRAQPAQPVTLDIPVTPDSAHVSPAPRAPAQRLILAGAGVVTEVDGRQVGVQGTAGIAEVTADGRHVLHKVTASDGAFDYVALPNDRLVTLGSKDLKPGVPREDGVWVTDLQMVLAVTGPGDQVQLARDVRVMGEHVRLVGATIRTAYLLRDDRRLVRHDLATGAEQPLAALSAALARFPRGADEAVDVAIENGRMTLTNTRSGPCRVRVVDVATGATLTEATFPPAGCTSVGPTRMSPDGRRVAVVTSLVTSTGYSARLVVMDVATGREIGTHPIVTVTAGSGPYSESRGGERSWLSAYGAAAGVSGLAWADNATVRVAWFRLPQAADRVYDLLELLRVSTISG